MVPYFVSRLRPLVGSILPPRGRFSPGGIDKVAAGQPPFSFKSPCALDAWVSLVDTSLIRSRGFGWMGSSKTPGHETSAHVPDWFKKYLQRGFRLIKFQHKQKGPTGVDAVDWPNKYIDSEDGYEDDRNWGVLLGIEIEQGRFLVDVDFDWQDGLPLSRRILPATAFAFGRGDRKVTHAFYTSAVPLPARRYEDVGTGGVLVELRGTTRNGAIGLQTMLPPSIHPSGEQVELRIDGDIAHFEDIERKITLYAIACILWKHLGQRGLTHDVRLATAGFLLGEGLEEPEVISVMQGIADISGNDVNDVPLTVNTTAIKLRNREKVKGKTALSKAIGDEGKNVLARIREWLGGGMWICDPKTDRIIPNSQENIRRAIEKLGVRLTFDEFAQRMLIKWGEYEGLLNDWSRNRLWLTIDKEFNFRPTADFFDVVIQDIAYENAFHPVKQYLDSLKWDGTPRLDTWLITYGKAADTDYTRAISALVLIAAVRRVRQPGCKFDELLVLESGQGLMKSSALRALCPNEAWFSDDLPLDVDAKQVIERTLGKWIIEAGELAGMRQSQVESLKAMLSRQVDGPVRLAYGRMSVERPRQFIAIGTTNSETYLKDTTGNRRFWPVRVEAFNVDGIRFVRDQLWAEAAHRESKGDSIRLRPELFGHATLQQERRRAEDPWEQRLDERFPRTKKWRLTPDEVWAAVGLTIDRRDERSNERILKAMTRLGFERKTVAIKNDEGHDTGVRVKGFARDIQEGQDFMPWEN